jgi:hypothetical protein
MEIHSLRQLKAMLVSKFLYSQTILEEEAHKIDSMFLLQMLKELLLDLVQVTTDLLLPQQILISQVRTQ